MPHRKGVTNNPYGRPKGVANKSTQEMRAVLQEFVERNIIHLQAEFDQLDSAERLRVLERFMQYLMPRYASIQISPIEERKIEPLVIVLTKDSENDAQNLTHPI
jgi:hypothetical protein